MRTSILLFIIICIICNSSCKPRHEASITNTKDTLLCYIMAGQSNMAGRGTIDPSDNIPDPRLLMLDTYNHFTLAQEPLDFYEPGLAGLSCGHAFGEKMLSTLDPQIKIGMIQCSIGSTSIEEWLGDSVRIIPLYTTLMARAREALAHGRLKGVLWQQGETNADNDLARVGYAEKLETFIIKFRYDIGDHHLPFFIGKISSWCKKPYTAFINTEIERVAREMKNVYLIETDDLSFKPDSLHYDAAGLRGLGTRLAERARPLLN